MCTVSNATKQPFKSHQPPTDSFIFAWVTLQNLISVQMDQSSGGQSNPGSSCRGVCLLTSFGASHSFIHASQSLWACMCAAVKVHSRCTGTEICYMKALLAFQFWVSLYQKVGGGPDEWWNPVILIKELSPSRFWLYSQYATRFVPHWSR